MTFGHEEPPRLALLASMDAKRLKQLEKGNTRLKKLLAEKGAGPADSPGGGGRETSEPGPRPTSSAPLATAASTLD